MLASLAIAQPLAAAEVKQDTELLEKNTTSSAWLGSIMFSTSELRKINKALESFGFGNDSLIEQGIEILQDSNLLSLSNKELVVPIFQLRSILYIAPKNWSVWVNGEKISHGVKHETLAIENINEKRVTFIWKTDILDRLSPNWKQSLPETKGQSHYNKAASIIYNEKDRQLFFTLEPNQTFNVKTMSIIEGATP